MVGSFLKFSGEKKINGERKQKQKTIYTLKSQWIGPMQIKPKQEFKLDYRVGAYQMIVPLLCHLRTMMIWQN